MGGKLYFAPDLAPPGAPVPTGYEAELLDLDGVVTVYTYGSDITVTKAEGASWGAIEPLALRILESAFRHYEPA